MSRFSRRDFLKWSGGALGALLAGWIGADSALAVELDGWQGRIISEVLTAYAEPDPQSRPVYSYWRDLVLPITEVAISDDREAHNRVWYRLGGEGYVYSGQVQPVRTQLQTPQTELGAAARLAEVCVPYTDARYDPDAAYLVAYRLYYATTHWVTGVRRDRQGEIWYRIEDDRFDTTYYARGRHLRLYSDEELAPLSPEIPGPLKKLEVRLDAQLVLAYERNQLVFVARTASGARFSNGDYSTPLGWYRTFHKRPTRHMAAGDVASNGFDLPGVPWVSYITKSGISFHGTYWHNDYGRPRSHGCINLTPEAARWIYRWSEPTVPPDQLLVYREGSGTYVQIIE